VRWHASPLARACPLNPLDTTLLAASTYGRSIVARDAVVILPWQVLRPATVGDQWHSSKRRAHSTRRKFKTSNAFLFHNCQCARRFATHFCAACVCAAPHAAAAGANGFRGKGHEFAAKFSAHQADSCVCQGARAHCIADLRGVCDKFEIAFVAFVWKCTCERAFAGEEFKNNRMHPHIRA
jgi:hypothetical protein